VSEPGCSLSGRILTSDDPQKGKLQCGVYKPTNVISISYGGTEFDLPVSYQRR